MHCSCSMNSAPSAGPKKKKKKKANNAGTENADAKSKQTKIVCVMVVS